MNLHRMPTHGSRIRARHAFKAMSACALAATVCMAPAAGHAAGATASTTPAANSTWAEYLRWLAEQLARRGGSSTGQTAQVTLSWVPPASTAVSGTVRLSLKGSGFKNVEIFSSGTKVAQAVVATDGKSATADIDTTRWANGSVTITAHAWDSVAGTPYKAEADAGPLTLTVNNDAAQPTGHDIRQYGAVCDGFTDDGLAIASAIWEARRSGKPAIIPAGVCAYGNIIELDSAKMIGLGESSVLYALVPSQEAIFIRGRGAQVRNLKLSGRRADARRADWHSTRITLFGASDFVIDRIVIDESAAAGIQTAQGATRGVISNNRISNTLSDSIHITDKASHIDIINNRIENSGDDGIAVVSYLQDGLPKVSNITARNNIVRNNKWGRLMSVVGGSNVLYENNLLDGNRASFACLYIAQENSHRTYAANDVVVRRNTLKNCGGPPSGHGAVMVYSDGHEANRNITLSANDIQLNGQPGIRIFGSENSGIRVEGNRIQGANPATAITAPGVAFTPYVSGPVGYVEP